MTPRYFPPPHSPEGNHTAGSRVQNASIGDEPVMPKNTMRAPTIKQENQDHPGKSPHDRLVLEHETRRIAANDDRKPAPVIKADPILQNESAVPKNAKRNPTSGQENLSQNPADDDRKPAPKIKTDPQHQDDSPCLPKEKKRRASMHPESEPVTKRAKKQDPPCRNYESQLIAVDCSNDILHSERDAAKEDVASSIATLREEIEAMSAVHKAALRQKETELEEWGAKCQRQVTEKQTIEANLVAANETIEVLQQDRSLENETIEVLQQDRSLELSELDERAAAISTHLEEAKGGLGIAKNAISNLEISLGKLTAERDERKTTIAGIDAATSEQLKSLTIDRDAAFGHTEDFETQLSSATEERNASRSELEACHAKAVELAATIDGLEECARETTLQMKALSGEKESALADVTKLQSMLTDSCQGHDVALSVLEASNSKIEALVTEQGKLQSRNKILEALLVDNTQAFESARSEVEAGTSTIAELKDDLNASVTTGATWDEEFAMADDDDGFGYSDDGDDDDNEDDDAVSPLVGRESSVCSTRCQFSRRVIRRLQTQLPPNETSEAQLDGDDESVDEANAGDLSGPAPPPSTATEDTSSRRGWRCQTQLPPNKTSEAQLDGDDDDVDGANAGDSSGSSWEDRLSELAAFRKTHGHCNVPRKYNEKAKLGKWVSTQRTEYSKQLKGEKSCITPFRIQELESLGFEWNFNDAIWKKSLSELADYRKIHGHCHVPDRYSKNTKLANWVSCQRKQYRLHGDGKASHITTLRIQTLEGLGFEWNSYDASWKKSLGQLTDYHNSHGHFNVTKCYSENAKLANWVSNQRKQYRLHQDGKTSLLTLSRIQALERLGFE